MIRSFAAAFPVVGIEKAKERYAQWIGVPVEVDSRWTWLHEVRPDAAWKDEELCYRTKRVTSVSGDGQYERALAHMAGSRPTSKR